MGAEGFVRVFRQIAQREVLRISRGSRHDLCEFFEIVRVILGDASDHRREMEAEYARIGRNQVD